MPLREPDLMDDVLPGAEGALGPIVLGRSYEKSHHGRLDHLLRAISRGVAGYRHG
jgi:hypothetical protein